jgi:3-oxoacyl-[acyl-carrier-protein] synthase-3
VNNSNDSSTQKFNAIIAGTGSYVPPKTLTNDDLEKIVETSDEWITSRTGIKVRHIASDDETTATLAAEAAKRAIENAGLTAKDIDMIVVATITPEMVFPSTACFVQDMIGATNAWAFDLSAACSGFVYALSIAQKFICSGQYKNILIIGAETLSKITDYTDRNSCVLFGDGAGAVVVQRSEGESRGIMHSCSSSDGSGWTSLNCQAHGSRHPASKKLADASMAYMSINGREIYQLAVRRIVEMVNESVESCGMGIEDIDMFIPHQMNARIIESVAKRLKFKDENVFINIEKYGNTSAASIPIALDECLRAGKVKRGEIMLLVAFGAGLTWGANLIEF